MQYSVKATSYRSFYGSEMPSLNSEEFRSPIMEIGRASLTQSANATEQGYLCFTSAEYLFNLQDFSGFVDVLASFSLVFFDEVCYNFC